MDNSSDESAFGLQVRALSDLAAQLQDVVDEQRIYELLAQSLRQVTSDDTIINVSAHDNSRGTYSPRVLLGLGRYMDKLVELLGRRPEDLRGDYTEVVKQAMATGRLTRIEDGVVELAKNSVPKALITVIVALIGITDVHVIGFRKGVRAGGISILTRRPGIILPAAIIEAMTMLGAVALERVNSEKERLKSHLITENIPVGLFLYHLENLSDDRTLRMIYANPAVKALIGLDPGDMVGKTLDANFPLLREQGIPQRYAEVVRSRTAATFEDITYGDDRLLLASFSVNAFPLPGHMVGIAFENTTARKRAGEELNANLGLLQIAGETAHFGGWIVDLKNNRCTWSDAVADIHETPRGFSPQLEEGIRFYAPEWRDRITQVFGACARDGIPYDEDMEILTTTGKRVWVRTVGRAVRNADGRIVKVQGSFQNITERKQAEMEKEKLQEQLTQAQKMESVGRLAGGVAHDFNNMLGVILGHTELALDHIGPDGQLCAHLNEIHTAAERSADLTRQLLAFARRQTVIPGVIDLNETVTGMLKMLRRLIGEDIDLIWRPGNRIGTVFIDPSQVDQMLANLCVNARDAITGTGSITIETDSASFDDACCARHAGYMAGEFVMLAVSDDGCGMDAETRNHLFEPFFTTKATGKGTGLGLATVYGAVRQNNGFIDVCSEPGKGTTIRIYLPRHGVGMTSRSEQPQDEVRPRAEAGETILLVEDEPVILRMTTMMLEKMGFTVIPAATPGEAVRLARECRGRIDLLITDVVMPEMNGRDLSRQLMSLHPHMGCLFMSGYTADVIAHHGVLDEGVYFIQKPFSQKDLSIRIREALSGSRKDEV